MRLLKNTEERTFEDRFLGGSITQASGYRVQFEEWFTVLSGSSFVDDKCRYRWCHWRFARIMEQMVRYYGVPSVSFDYVVARLLREDKLVMHALKDMYDVKEA